MRCSCHMPAFNSAHMLRAPLHAATRASRRYRSHLSTHACVPLVFGAEPQPRGACMRREVLGPDYISGSVSGSDGGFSLPWASLYPRAYSCLPSARVSSSNFSRTSQRACRRESPPSSERTPERAAAGTGSADRRRMPGMMTPSPSARPRRHCENARSTSRLSIWPSPSASSPRATPSLLSSFQLISWLRPRSPTNTVGHDAARLMRVSAICHATVSTPAVPRRLQQTTTGAIAPRGIRRKMYMTTPTNARFRARLRSSYMYWSSAALAAALSAALAAAE
mmetsp:Transcript_84367/g.168441  ORF Transcript_84367/g.168441 Transcript_84367/m.168441 type:complete len:280 (+) Transcript_84367:138-977(+)